MCEISETSCPLHCLNGLLRTIFKVIMSFSSANIRTLSIVSLVSLFLFTYQGRIQVFFRRGCTCLLLYFNTNKPQFFFRSKPVVLENRRSSQGALHPPPRSAHAYVLIFTFSGSFAFLTRFFFFGDLVLKTAFWIILFKNLFFDDIKDFLDLL